MDSEVDVNVPSHVFSLLSSSSTLMVLGCDLQGKLIERTWYLSAMVIFFFSSTEALFWDALANSLILSLYTE